MYYDNLENKHQTAGVKIYSISGDMDIIPMVRTYGGEMEHRQNGQMGMVELTIIYIGYSR